MLQALLYTVTAIFLYLISDWILAMLEKQRGKPFANRSLVFFVIILVLAVLVFEGLQRMLVESPVETTASTETMQIPAAPMPSSGVAASPATANEAGLIVHDPWIRSASPDVTVLAAYLRIENTADRPRILTGARSPNFENVEIHNSVVKDGLAHMMHQHMLEIPARSSLPFQPGGYHLMLIGRKTPLQEGDQVSLTLEFENGEALSTMAVVRQSTMTPHDNHHHHH